MGTMGLHTTKWQNLNTSPLYFKRDALINDVPLKGWNLGFMSMRLRIGWR